MSTTRKPPDPKTFAAAIAALPPYVDTNPDKITAEDNAYAKAAGEIWQVDLEHAILIPQIEFPGYPFQDEMMAVFEKAMLGHPFYIKILNLCIYAQFIINLMICERYEPDEFPIIIADQEKKPNLLRARVLAYWFSRHAGIISGD